MKAEGSVLSPDMKHLAGGVTMWGGVALAAASAVLVIPAARFAGVGLFVLSAAVSIGGAWLKKRHCPHCGAGACRTGGRQGSEGPQGNASRQGNGGRKGSEGPQGSERQQADDGRQSGERRLGIDDQKGGDR